MMLLKTLPLGNFWCNILVQNISGVQHRRGGCFAQAGRSMRRAMRGTEQGLQGSRDPGGERGMSSVSGRVGSLLIRYRKIGFIACLPWLSIAAAYADTAPVKRALLIGNDRYINAPRLKNAENDVRLLADALRQISFETTIAFNLSLSELLSHISRFADAIRPGDVALIYYAGHGVQSGGVNYLIPVGSKSLNEQSLRFEAVDIETIVSAANKDRQSTLLLVLDACRDTPFAITSRTGEKSLAAAPRGLAAPRKQANGNGTLIAFSTSPGSVAYDGAGANSPYAAALAKNIVRPELTVTEVFQNVRAEVMATTAAQGHAPQVPWESSSLTRTLMLARTYAGGQSAPRDTNPGRNYDGPEIEFIPLRSTKPERRDTRSTERGQMNAPVPATPISTMH
jgi:hypothetical protein